MSVKTHSFVALYTGDSIATARLIAASANIDLVRSVAERLLYLEQQETQIDVHVKAVREGRQNALSLLLNDEGENV